MAGKLVTLPLRASLRSAQLLTRAVGGVASRALAIPGRAARVASFDRSGDVERDADSVERDADRVERDAVSRPAPARDTPTPPAPHIAHAEPAPAPPAPHIAHAEPAPAPPAPPTHVSEEPVLVRESAETGAEEGAGAAVTVLEPWSGYGHMNARDVIDRVRTASMAELAAMRLYEARHRARRTVLAAVDRRMKLAGAAGQA
jgi:hypothetical protein